MTEKPPLWADLLLTAWVLVVALLFFGVALVPALGLWTDTGAGFYTLMVMVSAVTLALRYLKRHDAPKAPSQEAAGPGKPKNARTKTRKRL